MISFARTLKRRCPWPTPRNLLADGPSIETQPRRQHVTSLAQQPLCTALVHRCNHSGDKTTFVLSQSNRWSSSVTKVSQRKRQLLLLAPKNKKHDGDTWTTETLQQAVETLDGWLRQQPPSSRNLEHACRLLEQIVQKASGTPQRAAAADVDASLLAVHLGQSVHAIVHGWFHSYQQHGPSSSYHSHASPLQVQLWIDRLTTRSALQLRVGSDTWNLLLEAAVLKPFGPGTAAFAESLLHRILENQQQQVQQRTHPSDTTHSQRIIPNITFLFNKIMTLYIHEKDVISAQRCLLDLLELYERSEYAALYKPQPETVSIVLAAWAKQGSAREAERVLQHVMEYAAVSPSLDDLQPTKTHFESCLNAWRNSSAGQRVAGQRAELLLLKMNELHINLGWDTQPCIKSIGKVLQCWVESKHVDAAPRSQAILQLMREQYANHKDYTKTMGNAYADVMRAWSLSGARDASEKTQALFGQAQEQIGLLNMSPKDIQKAYVAMMTASTRSGRKGAAAVSQGNFDDMHRKCQSGEFDFYPSSALYNALLHAWARAGNGQRAEKVLEQMWGDYRAGNQDARPDTKSLNSVILAWSKSKDAGAADRAQEVFCQMQHQNAASEFGLSPDVVTYNALLSAMHLGAQDAVTARRGEQYLVELKELYAAGDTSCRPNAVTYMKAILLWSNIQTLEAVERSQALLDAMHEMVAVGTQTARPMASAYETVIQILLQSDLPDKQQRAEQVQHALKRLEQKGQWRNAKE